MEESYLLCVVSELESQANRGQMANDQFYQNTVKEITFTLGKIYSFMSSLEELLKVNTHSVNKAWVIRLKHGLFKLEVFLQDIDDLIEGTPPKQLVKLFSNLRNFRQEANYVANVILDELKTLVEWEGSVVIKEDIVGRDKDREEIVKMMLISAEHCVLVIPIIGVVGVGKTTLAQLVYNDTRIEEHFDVKVWLCVYKVSTPEDLLWELLKLIDYQGFLDCGMLMYEVVSSLRKAVKKSKYLLVLDDLSEQEDIDKWLLLKPLLCDSKKGSRVIVTSRSRLVCENMEGLQMPDGAPYELGSLPEEAAWNWVKSIEFEEEEERILFFNKCVNLPLAIKTAAVFNSLRDIKIVGVYLADVLREEDSIKVVQSTSRLISYHQLQSRTQKCCAYCSLFPKDYEYEKTYLIRVWMALGFVQPWTVEKAADDFFRKSLIDKKFFDIGKRDSTGVVVSYKMNTVANKLMKLVAKDDCFFADMTTLHIDDMNTRHVHVEDMSHMTTHPCIVNINIQHVSFVVDSLWQAPTWLLVAKHLQSLLFPPTKPCKIATISNMYEILSCLKGLRVLDLAAVNCVSLPDCVGDLKDLRYLRLGVSSGLLPVCIIRLKNLQTLDLQHSNVRELPKGFIELNHLRHLYTGDRLIDLPPSFGKLTSLQTLDVFIVGKNNGLDELSRLSGLVGKLKVRYDKHWGVDALYDKHWGVNVLKEDIGTLADREVTNLSLSWSSVYGEQAAVTGQDIYAVELEFLQPPSTLKSLTVKGWKGVMFPQWAMDGLAILLHNLVSVQIMDCSKCQHLPGFSALPHLVSLQLWDFNALEYVETDGNSISSATYFPSLEYLMLANLPELKGWSRENEDNIDMQGLQNLQLSQKMFPRLSVLNLCGCPKLLYIPLAPKLESLVADDIDGKLLERILCDIEFSSSTLSMTSRLLEVDIISVHGLDSLSISGVTLKSLNIRRCQELINVVVSSQISLQRLQIRECGKLKDISSALQSLSVLEELEIEHCEELDWGHMIDDNVGGCDFSPDAAWQGLMSLHSLKLINISKMEILPRNLVCLTSLQILSIYMLHNLRALPEWIGYLTQLRQIVVFYCPNLTTLPESIGSFSNLQKLVIRECPKLARKCQKLHGVYWPLIQHIPTVQLECIVSKGSNC